MSRKRTTRPLDYTEPVDPMTKPDPLYALTCNLNRVEYGYPGISQPRFYGQDGWPPLPELDPATEAPPWVPWAAREGRGVVVPENATT